MADRKITPILLITGFLGSGKTTLVAQWLRAPAMAGAMVIVNEFGEVGIDDRLVQSSSERTVLLENGCACCTAGEDLADTLERLFWQQLHREIPPMDWVLIETTGVADPGPILASLAGHPLLSERYRVAGTVTVIDARHGPSQVAAHEECRHQLEQASLVIVSKTDLASPANLDATEEIVRQLSHSAPILRSAKASLPIETVLELLIEPMGQVPHHHHGDHDGHAHGHPSHRHGAIIDSVFLDTMGEVDIAAIRTGLKRTRDHFGAGLLRLKGIVEAEDTLSSVQLDHDGTVEVTALETRPVKTMGRQGFTIITRGVAAADVAAFLSARIA